MNVCIYAGMGISVLIGSNLLAAAVWCKWVSNGSSERDDENEHSGQEREYDEFTRQQLRSLEKDQCIGLIPAP